MSIAEMIYTLTIIAHNIGGGGYGFGGKAEEKMTMPCSYFLSRSDIENAVNDSVDLKGNDR